MNARVFSHARTAVVIVTLALPAAASAQNTVASAQPSVSQEVNGLLDLAKLYVSQGRYDDASAMLAKVNAAIDRARGARTMVTTPVAVPSTPFGPPDAVRIGGAIKPPVKIHDVEPAYPEIARTAKIQGIVILEIVVDREGNVADARVLRSVQLLDQAALDAVRQWKFAPTLLNGVPQAVVMTVTVNFALK